MTFIKLALILLKVTDDLKSLHQIFVFPDNDRLSKIFPSFPLGFSFNPDLVSLKFIFI